MASALRVSWTPTAQRNLAGLPEKVATAVVEFIYGALADNPRRVGHELHLELAGHYSARRGEYRIIYLIDDETLMLTVVDAQHRRDVYRRG